MMYPSEQALAWAATIVPFEENACARVVDTPYSRVWKINAPQGCFYLKQTTAPLFIEAGVFRLCRDLCGFSSVAEVIADNPDLHCFLTKECADVSLRHWFKGQVNVDLLCEGLGVYREFQEATCSHIESFLQIGVPDSRLEKLPHLYDALVQDEALLKAQGMDAEHIKTLQDLSPFYASLCAELAQYQMPECLNNTDFHDNNLLISHATQKISLIDLGEVVIEHPFFSRLVFLKRTAARYDLKSGSSDFERLYQACFGADERLKKPVDIVEKILPVSAVLSHLRLIDASLPALDHIERMKNRIQTHLLDFMKACPEP